MVTGTGRRATGRKASPGAFTLVELLVVIAIIGILVSLLVPAIFGAYRRARQAQAEAQVRTLSAALESFKVKYGDYPPSRLLFHETGYIGTPPSSTDYYNGFGTPATAYPNIGGRAEGPEAGSAEFTGLLQRTMLALRSMFPKADFTPNAWNGTAPPRVSGGFDVNGDGEIADEPILLDGHECLYLFLCGVPDWQGARPNLELRGVGGLGSNARNPFVRVPAEGPAGRQTPFFDPGSPARMSDDDRDGVPGILDPIGSAETARYVAYFSSTYGGYDPRDVRLEDTSSATFAMPGLPAPITDVAPNPWTNGPTGPDAPRWARAQSYQLLSPGGDRIYGPGGEVKEDNSGAVTYPGTDRQSEEDNVGLR